MRAAGSFIAMLLGVFGFVGLGALLLFSGVETYKASAFVPFADPQSALYGALAGVFLSLVVAGIGFACLKFAHRGLGVVLLLLALAAAVIGGPLVALAMVPVCIAAGFVMVDRGKTDHRYRGRTAAEITGHQVPHKTRHQWAELYLRTQGAHFSTRGP